MRIKKGNQIKTQIEIIDIDKNPVTNLATAATVTFMLKKNITDLDVNAVLTKTLANGVSVNNPVLGSVLVTIDTPDTVNINPGTYYMALQIVYTGVNHQEVDLTESDDAIETVEIVEDIIDD